MKYKVTILCGILAVALAAAAAAKDKKTTSDDYTKHPGYVDFNALDIFPDAEAKIEVYLKEPMLRLVSKYVETEDPELFDMLKSLKLVRVQVFDVDRPMAEKYAIESSKAVKMLDETGWERVVRVREKDQHAYVYLKPSENYEWIQGIVVLAIEDYDEAVFVNIVGDIRPDDIGRLGSHFGVDELDSIRYEVKKGN